MQLERALGGLVGGGLAVNPQAALPLQHRVDPQRHAKRVNPWRRIQILQQNIDQVLNES